MPRQQRLWRQTSSYHIQRSRNAPTATTRMPPPENPPIDPFPPLRPTFSPVESRSTSYAAVVRRNTNTNTNTNISANTGPSASTNTDTNTTGASSAERDTEERYSGESLSGRERVHPWRENIHPWRERIMETNGNQNQGDTTGGMDGAGGSVDGNTGINANVSAPSSSSAHSNTRANTDSQTNSDPSAPFTLREMLRNIQAPSPAPATSSSAWASAPGPAQAPPSRSTSRIGVNGLPYVRYYDFNHPARDGNGGNVGMIMRENDDRPTASGCKSDQHKTILNPQPPISQYRQGGKKDKN